MRFSRFECFSVASSFPTVWIVENTQQPNSFLRNQHALISLLARRGQMSFQNPQVWSARSIAPSASMTTTLLSSVWQNLPFFPSPLCFQMIVLKKWNLYLEHRLFGYCNHWAATQIVGISFAHNREISEIMLISLRSREIGSGIDVTSPTPTVCCFTRTWTRWNFPQIENLTKLKNFVEYVFWVIWEFI